jgi:hypothetical protein
VFSLISPTGIFGMERTEIRKGGIAISFISSPENFTATLYVMLLFGISIFLKLILISFGSNDGFSSCSFSVYSLTHHSISLIQLSLFNFTFSSSPIPYTI